MAEGSPKGKANTMHFPQFFADEELDPKPLLNKKNTGPAEEVGGKPGPLSCTLLGKISRQEKRKVMKGKNQRSSGCLVQILHLCHQVISTTMC